MGKVGVAVSAAMRPLATVEVHVVYQSGFLGERLVAQGALVRFAGPSVHGHVPGEVRRVVEVLPAAGAGIEQVSGAGVDCEGMG